MQQLSRRAVYLLMVLAAAAWGFQPNCIKWLAAEWMPATITFIRYLLIGILLLSYTYFIEKKPLLPPRECWPYLALMGLTGVTVNNVTQFTGIIYTTVTNATLISAMTPAITALMAFLVIRERLSRTSVFGILISFTGVLLVVSHGSWEVLRNIAFNFGDVLCFISQCAWAVYTLAGNNVLHRMSPEWATGCSSICGALLTLVYGLAASQIVLTPLSGKAVLSFGYIALIGGIFAMVSWNVAVKQAGPSVTPSLLNIMPVVGMLSGHILFHDEIGMLQLVGAVAICLGVYLTTHGKNEHN